MRKTLKDFGVTLERIEEDIVIDDAPELRDLGDEELNNFFIGLASELSTNESLGNSEERNNVICAMVETWATRILINRLGGTIEDEDEVLGYA